MTEEIPNMHCLPDSELPIEPTGLTIEHILLSVTIVSNKESAGQFDDSCARIVEKNLKEYHGIERVDARVQYNHTKIEHHLIGCECHHCSPPVHDNPTP